MSSPPSEKSQAVVSGEELEEDDLSTPTKKIKIGDLVKKKGDEDEGVVKFIGTTKFAQGTWVGIELHNPVGKNNGSVKGVSYFNCRDKHGIFVKLQSVVLIESSPELPQQETPTKEIPESTQVREENPSHEEKFFQEIQLSDSQGTLSQEEFKISELPQQDQSVAPVQQEQNVPQIVSSYQPAPLKKTKSQGSESSDLVTDPLEELKIATPENAKAKFASSARKIVGERNLTLRKMMASQLMQGFRGISEKLDQVYYGLNDTLALTQDVSHNLCEMNDGLVHLRGSLPVASSWVDSFLASESKN